MFHLHGQAALPQSLVLTEDDHFDLLVATARHPGLLPAPVHRALRGGPLLFIGQPLTDWNFRALARSLAGTRLFAMICCLVSFSALVAMQNLVFTDRNFSPPAPAACSAP